MRPDFNEICKKRIIVFDGAMGTNIQNYNLTDDDFGGKDGCNEILNISRPDIIRQIHASFFKAGSDIVETNTFGANAIVLKEYGISDKDYELNKHAAQLAKSVANDFSTKDKPRWVAGSIGPGTKLPSLLQITFSEIKTAYRRQVQGLLDGGVDMLITETSQDLLQIKAALVAIFEIFKERKIKIPVITQVTMEDTDVMLLGSDMLTVITALSPFPVDVLGINCATGPKPMRKHIRTLAKYSKKLISVQPNAGLPENINGKLTYKLQPEEFASDVKYFAEELGANIVGGCCGTTPEYLKLVADNVKNIIPKIRNPKLEPAAASLYNAVPYDTTPKPLIIGERANANGSKKFREYLLSNDMNGMLSVIKKQEQEQAHIIDVCVAYTGLDEQKLMNAFIQRLNTDCQIPLMIDSTEISVIENALQRIGGKAIINSVNLEDKGKHLGKILQLCKKYGAAVVALTIDEDGMAKTADKKVEIAHRIYDIAVNEYNILPEDIFFDTLTFTLGSGAKEYRNAAVESMNAIKRIKSELPDVKTILGVSNVSFGLKPAIRHRLNSVFLANAIKYGLDAAILHPGKIISLHKLKQKEKNILENLIYNTKENGKNPITEILNYYETHEIKKDTTEELEKLSVEQRLKKRIIDSNNIGLEEDLKECLKNTSALDIINKILLDGMKTVGKLFGSGEMQLPFVLQSAETMKTAVSLLKPFMEKKTQAQARASAIIATVKGDVHDIGKNLVDIILTNNGFKIFNLGTKQPVESILKAYKDSKVDIIGMSGLLVRSTIIMKEYLEVMNEKNILPPVILGGAALTRKYVEKTLADIYNGDVYYAKDAFEALSILTKISDNKKNKLSKKISKKSVIYDKSVSVIKPNIKQEPKQNPVKNVIPPTSTFWGTKVVKDIPLSNILPFLNKDTLYKLHWGIKKGKKSKDEYTKIIDTEFEPILKKLIQKAKKQNLIQAKLIYGYFPCNSYKNSLLIYKNPNDKDYIVKFDFPRQDKENGWCIIDYFNPVNSGIRDIAGFQIVTIGDKASEESQRLFKSDKYKEYLLWNGFASQMAEALAEYWHKQMRIELKINNNDSNDTKKIFSCHYQGCRFSPGYAACPNLEDQKKIFQLLKPEQIGIKLTEEFQLIPEQSTSSIIVHHPDAKYFSVKTHNKTK